jgi:hypothetical protein
LTASELLSGVVLRADGHPASEARVSIAAVFHSPPLRLTTHTDDKGAFRVELERLSNHAHYALAIRCQNEGIELWQVHVRFERGPQETEPACHRA